MKSWSFSSIYIMEIQTFSKFISKARSQTLDLKNQKKWKYSDLLDVMKKMNLVKNFLVVTVLERTKGRR